MKLKEFLLAVSEQLEICEDPYWTVLGHPESQHSLVVLVSKLVLHCLCGFVVPAALLGTQTSVPSCPFILIWVQMKLR